MLQTDYKNFSYATDGVLHFYARNSYLKLNPYDILFDTEEKARRMYCNACIFSEMPPEGRA